MICISVYVYERYSRNVYPYSKNVTESYESTDVSEHSKHIKTLRSDPKIKQKVDEYNYLLTTLSKYENILNDLYSMLSTKLCPSSNSEWCSQTRNTTVSYWIDSLLLQSQHLERISSQLDDTISLMRAFLFPERNSTILYHLLLYEARRIANSNLFDPRLLNTIDYFTNDTSGLEFNHHNPLRSILGRNAPDYTIQDLVHQFLSRFVSFDENWISFCQKHILSFKFLIKSEHEQLSRLESKMFNSTINDDSLNITTKSNEENTWMDHFLGGHLSEITDSVEKQGLKDSDKQLEDQVNGGATLETVVRMDEKSNDQKSFTNNTFKIIDHSLPHREPASILADFDNNQYVLSKPKDPISSYEDHHFIYDIILILIISFILAILFDYIGLPSFFGYVLSGIIIGPSGFQAIRNYVQIESLSQFGVYFLIFIIGLEFSPAKVKRVWSISVISSCFLVISLIVLLLFWTMIYNPTLDRYTESVIAAICLSMCSTAVSLKLVNINETKKNISQPAYAQYMMGITIVQDVLLCIILALFPIISLSFGHGYHSHESKQNMFFIMELGIFVLKIVLLFLVVYLFTAWINRYFKSSETNTIVDTKSSYGISSELISVSLLVFCLSGAWICDYLGLSMELGCFISGLFIGSIQENIVKKNVHSPFEMTLQHAIQRLVPVTDFFTIFFFNSIGLHANPRFLLGEAMGLLYVSTITVILKTFILWIVLIAMFSLTSKRTRCNKRGSLLVALGSSHISEFSFVIASHARKSGMFSREAYYVLAGTTSCCLILVPILYKLTRKIIYFVHRYYDEHGEYSNFVVHDFEDDLENILYTFRNFSDDNEHYPLSMVSRRDSYNQNAAHTNIDVSHNHSNALYTHRAWDSDILHRPSVKMSQ